MAGRKQVGSRYFLVGAAYWIVIAALAGLCHVLFPDLLETPRAVTIAVVCTVVAGFVAVYLARPKS